MKKTIVLSCVAAIAVCSLVTYCWASDREVGVQNGQPSQAGAVTTAVSVNRGKVLIAYFSVPLPATACRSRKTEY